MTRVLVVEDEESYSDALAYMLRKEGFEVGLAATGPDALVEFDRAGADIVLLDLMLPGFPGTEVCRRIRQTSNVPVIMVSAKDEEVDKVVGLELGADDYITKPFSIREFRSRVRALLRRVSSPRQVTGESSTIEAGEVLIDLARRTVEVGGNAVQLTYVEFELLRTLASSPGVVFSRQRLLEALWGGSDYREPRTIDVHVRHLREKLEPDPSEPRYLQTVRGAGYRFAA